MNYNQKARNNNLLQASDGNFGAAFAYRCDNGQPIERCLDPEFFDTVKTRLGPGDSIRCIEYTQMDNKTYRVSATITLLVVSRSPEPEMTLDVRPYNGQDIYRYEDEQGEEKKPEPKLPDVKYIPGTGQVEQDKVSKLYRVKCDGEVIYETEKRGLAMAISRGDAPIPQE